MVSKCWVNTRVEDWPAGGSLQLGQILRQPLDPNTACIPPGFIAAPPKGTVESSTRLNVSEETKDEVSAGFRAWIKVPNLATGGNLKAEGGSSSRDARHFKSLQSQKAIFGTTYVQAALDTEYVKAYFQSLNALERKFKHVWMITGIRVANEATKEMLETRNHDLQASANLDGSAVNAPVEGGLDSHQKSKHEHSQSSEGGSDYIFQYRVHRVNKSVGVLTDWDKGHSETVQAGDAFDFELVANERSPLTEEDLGTYAAVSDIKVDAVEDDGDDDVYFSAAT
ncbi:hypothetical protein B0I35DRAFT_446027 [Stachybotrys elegans]|uniref:Uncharacterized protein n=1 Tax=Stachybotrys elegans TaxID=80388 RepID=A0A8K0SGM5_9HYPO|nr:hypothetical protein B0I35DRAFT_446027 [Stachybotrys elegans]